MLVKIANLIKKKSYQIDLTKYIYVSQFALLLKVIADSGFQLICPKTRAKKGNRRVRFHNEGKSGAAFLSTCCSYIYEIP